MNFNIHHRKILKTVFMSNGNNFANGHLFEVSGQSADFCGIWEPDHRALRAAALEMVDAGYCDFADGSSGEFTVTMTAAGWDLAKHVNS